jgi:hypothetical protein
MSIKVKETTLEPNGKSVRVIVETPEGNTHEFFAKTEHMLDEKTFENLLRTWDRMVKEKEAQAELKEEDIEKILKKREKMEIKD